MAARRTPELGTPGCLRTDGEDYQDESINVHRPAGPTTRNRYGSREPSDSRNADPIDIRDALRIMRERPPVTPSCPVCGRDTAWMRTDARYCSNACRQRAYRARKGVT
jgi:hypothetical protein